jgi:hypothetical protein
MLHDRCLNLIPFKWMFNWIRTPMCYRTLGPAPTSQSASAKCAHASSRTIRTVRLPLSNATAP